MLNVNYILTNLKKLSNFELVINHFFVQVKPRFDLPVGKNLRDHVGTFLFPFLINKPVSFIAERDLSISDFTKYFMYGSGT